MSTISERQSGLVRYPGPGCIVEFMQGNQPHQAFVLEENNGQLRLYTTGRREVKMPLSRLLPWSGPMYSPDRSRQDMQILLEEHKERRRAKSASIKPLELWSMAQGEMAQASAQWFAELLWQSPGVDDIAAMGAVLLECKTHFKFQPPDFEIYNPEKVEIRLRELEAARMREQMASRGQSFLRALWDTFCARKSPEQGLPPLEPELAARIESLLRTRMADPDDHDSSALWKEIVKSLPDNEHLPMHLLQAWGKIPPHYNFWLDRADYAPKDTWSGAFAEEIEAIHTAAKSESNESALFENRPFVSIDSATTMDIDDAFHVHREADGTFKLVVALANPAGYWPFGSALDRAVLRRGTSVYLPEATHHMLPESFGAGCFSLKAECIRPAFFVDAIISPKGELLQCEPRRGVVRIAANLTYEACEIAVSEADWQTIGAVEKSEESFSEALKHATESKNADSIPSCPPEALNAARPFADMLHIAEELAQVLQEQRLIRGAVVIERPDPQVVLHNQDTEVLVDIEPGSSCPRMQLAVSEIMILANSGMAEWAKTNNVPLLHRTQDVTVPREYSGVWSRPQDIARVVKVLSPAILEVSPRPHAGIGVPCYCPVTSPLRRYTDLLNEAQILSCLAGNGPKWSAEELNSLLPLLNVRLDAAGQMQRFRPRYWKLVFFKQQGDKRWYPGIITEENDTFATVAMPQYQMLIRGRRNLFGDKIFPGAQIEVRIGKVNPLTNDITVIDAREPENL